jgi:hypothetical protein
VVIRPLGHEVRTTASKEKMTTRLSTRLLIVPTPVNGAMSTKAINMMTISV